MSMKVNHSDGTSNENAIVHHITAIGILGNIVLTAFKLFAGIVGKSGAMVSDAVHSLSDVFATFIAFLGVKLSKRSADKQHPYGHERVECIASLLLGIILLLTGLGMGKIGLEDIFSGRYENLATPGTIALVAAVISIVAKESMYWYTRHYAKILNSSAFMADAWHHRSDSFSSIGSLIGISGAKLGFPVMDAVASVIICLCILKVAYDILTPALANMLDTSCGEKYEQEITNFVTASSGVLNVDLLHTRMFGNRVYIDLEIQVDGDKSLREAHTIAEQVHSGIESTFPNVKHVMIHVNPSARACPHKQK